MERKKISLRLFSDLESLLDREAHEIRAKRISRLPAINHRKDELVSMCEEALANLALGRESELVVTALDAVRRKAEKNAADLQAIKQGMIEARRRIEWVAQDQSRSGLYSENGDEIRGIAVGLVNRNI